MQLLPWPTYLPDMFSIEHAWDLVGQRLVCDPHLTASKDELRCAYKQYGVLFRKQAFNIGLAPCHVV
ncbi:hypothetical protein TNCV_124091 [Trichonephila clavipes]|nr:hypothetical protein TNCV_124091 [Trichonephila clavipes]